MCAKPDKRATDEFRNRKGRQRAYKVIYRRTGRPYYFNSRPAYHPGGNVDYCAVKTYLGYARGVTRGLHCYVTREAAIRNRAAASAKRELTVVCVSFDPSDVIVAESLRWPGDIWRVIVVRTLHISDRAWKQAGLPKQKGGG